MSQYKLATEIIALSGAKQWDEAKPEWELIDIYQSKTPRTCLCGHSPIIEVCILHNKATGKMASLVPEGQDTTDLDGLPGSAGAVIGGGQGGEDGGMLGGVFMDRAAECAWGSIPEP